MAPRYRNHRATMDNVTRELNLATTQIEKEGAETLRGVVIVLGVLGAHGAGWGGRVRFGLCLKPGVRPAVRTTQPMRAMANGDLSSAIEGDTRADEIGDAARALVGFRQAKVDKRALEKWPPARPNARASSTR